MSKSLPPSLYSFQFLSYPFLPTLSRSLRVDGFWLLLFFHLWNLFGTTCVYIISGLINFVLNSQLESTSFKEVNSFLAPINHLQFFQECDSERLPLYRVVCLFLLLLHRSCLGSPNIELSRAQIPYHIQKTQPIRLPDPPSLNFLPLL